VFYVKVEFVLIHFTAKPVFEESGFFNVYKVALSIDS